MAVEKMDKKQLFAYYLTYLGSPKLAAIKSGYPKNCADEKAAALLLDDDVISYTEKYSKIRTCWQVSQGLRRLAFGDVNDCVEILLKKDEQMPNFANLDLFHIKEIKTSKTSGFEMRFHDRIAALETLININGGENSNLDLYKALMHSANMLGETNDI